MLAIDDRDVTCTIMECVRHEVGAKLLHKMTTTPEEFEDLCRDIARNVAQAVLLCGDEMPDHLIAEMAKYVRER